MSPAGQLALYGISIHVCPHFTVHETYRWLLEDIFTEELAHKELRHTQWVQGFSTGEFQQRFGSQGGSFAGGESQHLNRSFGQGGQNLTGAGEGTEQATLDNDGGSVKHRVGRGVTV